MFYNKLAVFCSTKGPTRTLGSTAHHAAFGFESAKSFKKTQRPGLDEGHCFPTAFLLQKAGVELINLYEGPTDADIATV